jgi:L-ascorbate metabolism protein UlaG (beta-lactamase superfamily)
MWTPSTGCRRCGAALLWMLVLGISAVAQDVPLEEPAAATGAATGVATGVATSAATSTETGEALPEPTVTLEYVAHACFRITAPTGERLLLDPFADRVWIGYDFPPGPADVETVLITHPHYDHDGGTSLGRRGPWPEDASVLRKPGVHLVQGFTVTGVAGKHADPWGKEFGQTNTIWCVEVAGLRIVHLGDNGPLSEPVLEALQALGSLDVLMIPVDDEDHILARGEVADIVRDLSPRLVLPMHYRHADLELQDDSPDDLGGIDTWLERQKRVRRVPSHRLQLRAEDLPEKTGIVVLEHWPELSAPEPER